MTQGVKGSAYHKVKNLKELRAMNNENNRLEFDGMLEFMDKFPTEDSARKHFAFIRWGDSPVCPLCGHEKVYTYNDGKRYKCAGCKKQFTVKSGTVFEDSKIGMRKWFLALYLLTNMKKGISSCEMARKLKVTQKTAWFMEHRLRHALEVASFESPQMKGVVEADETYVGGKTKWKHAHKIKRNEFGSTLPDKTRVCGLKERGSGKVFAKVTDKDQGETIGEFVTGNVAKGSILMTDEHQAYKRVGIHYDHRVVCHRDKEYATGIDYDTTTNGIENYWSHLKRSITGVYHYTSPKHMNKYLATESFRYNFRDVSEWEKFTLAADQTQGKRITYKALKGG